MIIDEKLTTFKKEISQKKSAGKQAVKRKEKLKMAEKKLTSIIHK